MRVLFATPEIAPWVKAGGLGDVSAALPTALARAGIDMRVLVPGYPALLSAFPQRQPIAHIDHPAGALRAATLSRVVRAGAPDLLLLESAGDYERPGGPYQDPRGHDWADNPLRFGLLSRVAALLASSDTPLDWKPAILHCNDWPTALAPAYLRYRLHGASASVVTIHNLAFQGLADASMLGALDLPDEAMRIDGVEFHGRISFLKAGLQHGDRITTVSPTYAREICEPEHGCGLDGLLRYRRERRSGDLSGILNGIDSAEWNPALDPHLAANYSADRLDARLANRGALAARLGINLDADTPLLGMVSRMTHQKGTDLVLAAAHTLIADGACLAVLGSGDTAMQQAWRELAMVHRGRIGLQIGFDESLAHLIEAGADLFLMPSRFEPCGLNQMYSLAYGTPPVVRATGGLADTVVDCNAHTRATGAANGFSFTGLAAADLVAAIRRAITAWREPALWRELQRNGMARDWGWSEPARQYVQLYRSLAP